MTTRVYQISGGVGIQETGTRQFSVSGGIGFHETIAVITGPNDGTIAATERADVSSFVAANETRAVTLTLVVSATDGSARASLSGLKWAFYDAMPWTGAAPIAHGTTETTDGSGVIVIPLPGSTLGNGATGWLLVTDSDGTTGTNPNAFAAPVQVAVA